MAGVTFNPVGNVIALQDGGTVIFVAMPRPACELATRCLTFQPTRLPTGVRASLATVARTAGPAKVRRRPRPWRP